MSADAVALRCLGCGHEVPPDEPYPFRCPEARVEDDIDHVIAPEWRPDPDPPQAFDPPEGPLERNPFWHYRKFLHCYRLARAHGLREDDYGEIVQALDDRVAAVCGRRFVATPVRRGATPEPRSRPVWIKDETQGVGGSHKARHLLGILIHLEVIAKLGWAREHPPLAIASCGNAALAAAILARAAERHLDVYVPEDANPPVLDEIREHGADVHPCRRRAGQRGDPSVAAFRDAVSSGSLPFSCQGPENGLVLDSGKTLGLEVIFHFERLRTRPQHICIQVGGGALASSVLRAYGECHGLDAPGGPRFYAVQTEAVHPLKLAYDRLVARILRPLPRSDVRAESPRAQADRIRKHPPAVIATALDEAAHHRSEFMKPWGAAPWGAATGILDDETYDWRAIVAGLLGSGGFPVVVPDELIRSSPVFAYEAFGIDVSATGAAGLTGLLHLDNHDPLPEGESALVFLTGASERPTASGRNPWRD